MLATRDLADFQAGLEAADRGDYHTAVEEFQLSAERGDVNARYNLGVMYQLGLGVPQDDQEAVRWYRLAAEQGHASAQFNLGVMYAKGQGVSQDCQEADRWYQLAADQGDALAQFNLGVMYGQGEGVPKDYVLAHMWLNLAAAKGLKEAVKGRDFLRKRMTPAQLAEAQRLAREWTPNQ